MIFLSIFFIFFHSVNSEGIIPTIINRTPDPMVNIGSNIELSCIIQDLQNYSLIWSKISKDHSREWIPLFSGSQKLIQEHRFSVHNGASQTHTLRITGIKDSDSGFYKCSIPVNSDHQISKEIHLQVKVPPIIYENSTASITVPLYNATKLECYVSGQPPPDVFWTRENNELLPTGNREHRGNFLRIINVTKEHAGTYYCNANNNVSSSVRKSFKLEVEYSPEVYVVKPRVGQALSFNAVLECRVSAVPTPVIVWVKDGSQIQNSQHYRISHHATENDYNASVLHITSVERSQYGNYTCKATNKLGDKRAVVEFYETDHEECSPTCGSGLGGYPDFKLIFSTTSVAILLFVRW